MFKFFASLIFTMDGYTLGLMHMPVVGASTEDTTKVMKSLMNLLFLGVAPRLFAKGRTPVLCAIPWINDSTTVQNEIFIA
jgi:hypothetical protein